MAGADIFITGQGMGADGFVVARSAADGTFRVRSLGGMCYIGARAEGYAPSTLPLLHGDAGGEKELTLVLEERGGAVAGVVLDPLGEPVRNALVAVDPDVYDVGRLADGTQASVEHGFHAFFRHYYNLDRFLHDLGVTKHYRAIEDYLVLTRDAVAAVEARLAAPAKEATA